MNRNSIETLHWIFYVACFHKNRLCPKINYNLQPVADSRPLLFINLRQSLGPWQTILIKNDENQLFAFRSRSASSANDIHSWCLNLKSRLQYQTLIKHDGKLLPTKRLAIKFFKECEDCEWRLRRKYLGKHCVRSEEVEPARLFLISKSKWKEISQWNSFSDLTIVCSKVLRMRLKAFRIRQTNWKAQAVKLYSLSLFTKLNQRSRVCLFVRSRDRTIYISWLRWMWDEKDLWIIKFNWEIIGINIERWTLYF